MSTDPSAVAWQSSWSLGPYSNSRTFAEYWDTEDALRDYKQEFVFPPAPPSSPRDTCIYLCGNSLGLQPRGLQAQIQIQLNKWSEQGVEAHFDQPTPWVSIDDIVVDSMANLVGALPSEVVVMNSLTANLHLMMSAFYKPNEKRFKIMTEKRAFPSDTHAVVSQIKFHGLDPAVALVEVAPREGEVTLRTEDILATIREHGDSLALVMLSGVQYGTGQFFDIPTITKETHAVGAVAGWDLAHAVGNVILSLHEWDVDFACWCTYKYLNSGPGCIGGCFVHERNGRVTREEDGSYSFMNRFSGWWGHRLEDRFQMDPEFIPVEGAYGFRLSNPPVVCVACVRASLDVFDKAGMPALRAKSVRLTAYLEYLIKEELADDVSIFTPVDPDARGCQLSLTFNKGNVDDIFEKLKGYGVVCDVRKPNIMRIAPTPLYNSFTDVFDFVSILKAILASISS
mmetsp:Transcript_14108/g.21108  ORF Transcript_14108/g.21108 Transcript_14108/m.21108 type:complete len:454 (-) Transcript_14108:100-1461(-)